MHEMKNAAGESGGEIRAEIERAIFFDAAREIDAGIFFGGGELDVRVGFIVAQDDVKFRAVLLNEVVLEGQRFMFVIDNNGLEIGNLACERAGFGVDPAGFEEIGAHAATEGRRFANIKHGTGGVFEDVDAGTFRKQRGDFSGFHGRRCERQT